MDQASRGFFPIAARARLTASAHGLGTSARLLEREGVEALHERVARVVGRQRAGEVQHLRKAPLPEPDEVEPLEDDEVARVRGEVPPHRLLGVPHLALDEQGERLDVAPLALGLRPGRGPRRLRGLARLGEALLEEEADGRARVGEREPGILGRRVSEQLEGAPVPAQEPLDATVVGLERGRGTGGDGQPIRVATHGAHASPVYS